MRGLPLILACLASWPFGIALAGEAQSDYVIGMKIEETLKRTRETLMERPGVAGVGVGLREGKPVIVLMLERDSPEVTAGLPEEIEGHRVVVEVVGEITAY